MIPSKTYSGSLLEICLGNAGRQHLQSLGAEPYLRQQKDCLVSYDTDNSLAVGSFRDLCWAHQGKNVFPAWHTLAADWSESAAGVRDTGQASTNAA